NAFRFALTTREISDSKGMPPRSLNQATRTPLKLRPSGARNRAPSSAIDSGSAAYGPTIVLRNSATSATVRAIGPAVDNGDHEPSSSVTRPGEGRKPTMLLNAAGLRSDATAPLPVRV